MTILCPYFFAWRCSREIDFKSLNTLIDQLEAGLIFSLLLLYILYSAGLHVELKGAPFTESL